MPKRCGFSHHKIFGWGWWCSAEKGHDGPAPLWPIWQAPFRKLFY